MPSIRPMAVCRSVTASITHRLRLKRSSHAADRAARVRRSRPRCRPVTAPAKCGTRKARVASATLLGWKCASSTSRTWRDNVVAKRKEANKPAEYLTPEAQKGLADRLARIEGHVRSIRQVVVDHRCADEVLIQIAAGKAALNQSGAALIDCEMRSCVDPCMGASTAHRLARVSTALAAV